MNSDRKRIVRLLNESIGEPATEAVTSYVDIALKDNNESMYNTHLKNLATKEDLANLRTATKEDLARFATKEDLANFRTEIKTESANFRTKMQGEFADFRAEMHGDFANFRTEVKGDLSKMELNISDTKSDIIRWMFAVFVIMLLALLGLYFKK